MDCHWISLIIIDNHWSSLFIIDYHSYSWWATIHNIFLYKENATPAITFLNINVAIHNLTKDVIYQIWSMRISSKQMFNTRLFHTHSFLDDAVNKWMLRWITLFTRNYIQRPLLTIKTIYLSRKKVQHEYFDCRVRLKMSSVLVLLDLLLHTLQPLNSTYFFYCGVRLSGGLSEGMCLHTWYFWFFLHGQNFWRIKFTPKNANFSR